MTTSTETAEAVSQPSLTDADPVFQDRLSWYLGVSAFWFATSMKWFVLFLLQPIQVASIVEGGEKNGAWGTVVAIGATEAMFGPAICGYLSDRCGSRFGRRRPFIAIGAALTAIALLFLGQASSLWMMIVGYLCLQISDDIGTGPYAAIIPDRVPEKHRGRASGIMSLLQLVAQIAAVAVALPLHDITKIYVAVAIVNIVCAVIVLFTVREGRYDFSTRVQEAGSAPPKEEGLDKKLMRGLANWIAPFRSPDFRWVWFTRFLTSFGFYLILLYVSNYLSDRIPDVSLFGKSVGSVKNAALIAGLSISLAGGIASVFAGKLADRIGRKKVIIYAGWLMFVTLVPFALIPHFTTIFILALIFGLGYGSYLSADWALVSDVLPNKDDAAKDMGIWQSSIAMPQILTGIVGTLVDFGNRQQIGLGYTIAFLLSACAFLAGSLLITRVKGST